LFDLHQKNFNINDAITVYNPSLTFPLEERDWEQEFLVPPCKGKGTRLSSSPAKEGTRVF